MSVCQRSIPFVYILVLSTRVKKLQNIINFSLTTVGTFIQKMQIIENYLSIGAVASRASHLVKLPCQTTYCFFLLVCFRRLSTLLRPMCVILVVYCKSCVCWFTTSSVPSLTPSPHTVAALLYDFTDQVILTEKYPSSGL